MSVSVVIPALNEEESIAVVLEAIPRHLVGEILVVDGGSTDRTASIARRLGARLVDEPRRGYGRACAAGLAAAGQDIVVFLDADGADDASAIEQLITPLLQNAADLVLGSRLMGGLARGSMPWHQQLGNRLAAWLFRRLYQLQISDLSPLRAVDRRKLLALGMREMTYGWPTEMIARAAVAGWRIIEIPVTYRRRLGGKSKISGTLRGSLLASIAILRTIFVYFRWPGRGRR